MGGIYILCLQEVKTVGLLLHTTLSIIWLGAKYFCYDHFEEKGGMVILVSP